MGSVIKVEFNAMNKIAEKFREAEEERESSIVAMITAIRATVDTYAMVAGWGAVHEFLQVETARAEYMKEHKGA